MEEARSVRIISEAKITKSKNKERPRQTRNEVTAKILEKGDSMGRRKEVSGREKSGRSL